MLLPLDRHRMRERNRIDQEEAWDLARRRSPAKSLHAQIELSDLVRNLRVNPSVRGTRSQVLAEKSRLWVAPLKAVAKAKRGR